MADDAADSLTAYTKADIDLDNARQDFCCRCQSSHIWEFAVDTDTAPTLLACGHSMCFNCMKTQWLDVATQDGTVFCLGCSKRESIMHVNSAEKEVCEDQIVSEEQPLSARSEDGTSGIWKLEQKDRMQLQGWVNGGICDSFVLKLITSSANSCLPGNPLILNSTSSTVGNLMEPVDTTHSASSLTPVKQEIVSDKSLMRYIVGDSISETGISNTNFHNKIEMQGPTNALGSPDLNLKALLQMLEKNSLPSLGDSVESTEANHGAGCITDIHKGNKGDVLCLDKAHTVCGNLDMDRPAMSEKQLCEEMGIDDEWLPVGIVHNESCISRKERIPVGQSLPCTVYLPSLDNAASEDYICMNGLTSQSKNLKQLDKINGDPVSHVWYSQADRDFQHKGNPRSRRGRKRKPLLRHYQSELFMRPYLKQEHSPQLQLVKLVRQRAQDRKDEEKVVASISHEEKFLHKPEIIKKHVEDPELAFMKTVDMPSGKRVEDIYVVPSVWISNERKNAGKPSCVKEPAHFSGSDLCNYLPADGSQRVPIQVSSHGNHTRLLNTCQAPCWRQGQSSFGGSQSALSHAVPNSSRRGLHSTSFSNAHAFKPAQNLYKVIRGHIITTLNAPKIEPVPSLKDLCKSVLALDTEAAISQMRENKYASTGQNHLVTQHSLNEPSGVSKETSLEIKTPKEFLDMGSTALHVSKVPEMGSGTRQADKEGMEDGSKVMKHQEPTGCMMSPVCAAKNGGEFDIHDTTEALMDNQDTLPENPLFTDDSKKVDGINCLALSSDSCHHLQAATIGHQFQDQAVIYSAAEETLISSVREDVKYMYPTVSLNTCAKSSSEYVIPIVSYKLTDVSSGIMNSSACCVSSGIMNSSACCEQQPSDCPLSMDDSGSKNIGMGSFSFPSHRVNSYPVVLDDSFTEDTFESNLMTLPSLVSVTKQIRILSSLEPLNKPLAGLTAALNLLSSAEKTLCDSNFVLYRQVKCDTKSKLGHLNLCIRKLGDVITTLGGTLQEWMKDTNNRCFKTMGVLTDLYNSNIAALSELITPYFHYMCELIASCHTEVMPWSKQEPSDIDPAKSLGSHLSVTAAGWLDADLSNSMPCEPDDLATFAFAENQQPLSPNSYKRQDYDPLLPSKEDSETSLSGPGSTKVSPRLKGVVGAKRGRPQGSKNGQRRTKVNLLKNKPKQILRPLGLRRNQSTYSDLKFGGKTGMLLPNTVLVNIAADSMWDDGSATDVHRAQTVASHMAADQASDDSTFGKDDQNVVDAPGSTTSWVFPPDARDTCRGFPVHLSVADGSGATALSLLDSELHGAMGDTDGNSVEESKDSSMESSPNKKSKYEQDDTQADASNFSNIVVALPEGINIMVSSASGQTRSTSNSSSTGTMRLHDSTTSGLNICTADFQNIYFIHNTDNPGNYLQLDPHQLSAALLNSFRSSKDVHGQFQMAMMPSGPNPTMSDSIKHEVEDSQAESCLDPDVNSVNGKGFMCGASSSEDADSL